MKFIEMISNIKNAEHYLKIPSEYLESYSHGLFEVLAVLETRVKAGKFKDLISKKLQVSLGNFDESQYIQSACELTVLSNYVNRSDIEFTYEKNISGSTDVDLSIRVDGVNYNIEVKCPSYNHVNSEAGSVECIFTNRAESLEEKNKVVMAISQKLAEEKISVVEGKNLDNKMKDYLLSVQEKVDSAPAEDVNVLVVCCDDAFDMHRWRGYLFNDMSGLFTPNSFINPEAYSKVDFVLLTNIYNRHHNYFDSALISNYWRLDNSFNLLYPNRFSLKNKFLSGRGNLDALNKIFPNHNVQFEDYMKDDSDLPENESIITKKNIAGIAWYTDKYKVKGKHYFK